jgi:hypothetical protein
MRSSRRRLSPLARLVAAAPRHDIGAHRNSGPCCHVATERVALQRKLLRYLAGVGVVAARENAQLAAEFRLPQNRVTDLAFITLAQGMLEKATAHQELLMKQGLSERVLGDIGAALEEFEQTLEATRAARRDHVGASGDLEVVMSGISEQVRLLEGLVRYRFGEDAELIPAWTSARNVLGPFRSRGEAGAGGGETPGEVKPAA